MSERDIVFRVRRFRPGRDDAPVWERFEVPVHAGMTVLQGLMQIRENQDATLSWRSSCRMGVCGSCAMVVNGRPRLACNTQVRDVSDTELRVAPLTNFRLIKDLVTDLSPMFEKHRSLSPFVVRSKPAEVDAGEGEFIQSREQLTRFLQFSYCIKCGACMSACPTLAMDARFLGPMPLAAAHRYNADTRDQGFQKRRDTLAGQHAIWHCHYAGECSRVCPKGVDPARAIQLMKGQLVRDALGLGRSREGARRVTGPAEPERARDIPKAPPYTAR